MSKSNEITGTDTDIPDAKHSGDEIVGDHAGVVSEAEAMKQFIECDQARVECNLRLAILLIFYKAYRILDNSKTPQPNESSKLDTPASSPDEIIKERLGTIYSPSLQVRNAAVKAAASGDDIPEAISLEVVSELLGYNDL